MTQRENEKTNSLEKLKSILQGWINQKKSTMTATSLSSSSMYHRFRAILHLWLMQSLIPVSVTFVLIQYVSHFFRTAASKSSSTAETLPVAKEEETSRKNILMKSKESNTTSSSSSLTSEETSIASRTNDSVSRSSFTSSESDTSSVTSDSSNEVTSQEEEQEGRSETQSFAKTKNVEEPTNVEEDKSKKDHYTIVLTGGKMSKTLHMVRCLRSYANSSSKIQMKIIVMEQDKFRYCNTRFSSCVSHFEIITSPRVSSEKYMQDIYDVCSKYQATHFLPVAAPVEAVYDAKVKERLERDLGVKVLHMNHDLCQVLDNKHEFGCFLMEELGLAKQCLKTFQVTSNEQVKHYNEIFKRGMQDGTLKRPMVLKNLQYDPIHRLDLFQLPCSEETLDEYLKKIEVDGNPIKSEEPWQLQEFLEPRHSQEYAAMIVVRDNQLVTMTCCPSSASQLNYVHVEVPSIRTWINDFLYALRQTDHHVLTGQLCFDFMVVNEERRSAKGDSQKTSKVDQVAYPIECNPRVHTQCSIYNRDDVRALFGELLLLDHHDIEKQHKLVQLLERDYNNNNTTKHQQQHLNVYWFYNEFFKIFPNSWLLSYNDGNDTKDRCHEYNSNVGAVFRLPTVQEVVTLLAYLPALAMSFLLVLPVLIAEMVVLSLSPILNNHRSSGKRSLNYIGHLYVMLMRLVEFFKRLVYFQTNIEGDCTMSNDLIPFLAKNHIQVPFRLCASIKSGVEWKKIDFAIGKVVEVGGD